MEQNILAVGAQPHSGHCTGLCSNLSFPSVLGAKAWSSESSGAAYGVVELCPWTLGLVANCKVLLVVPSPYTSPTV